LDCFKHQIAKKYKLSLFKNSELLSIYHEFSTKKLVKGWALPLLEKVLIKRPIRSLSGIINVSVLTKPYPCPGKCIFCPTQKNIPKSYLAGEPAVQRAIANKFSPYKQVEMRLKALKLTGHPIDKVELRIIGGTWSYYPKAYQKKFVAECFRACNNFGHGYEKLSISDTNKLVDIRYQQLKNEKVKSRIVGIAVETRPDYITLKEITLMRELGVTKVELGVQAVDNKILKLNQRGHSVEDITKATKLLKNTGFKVSYQIMPGLFGSNPKKDLVMFQEIFTNPDFKPDYLKIYPLALVKNTELYNLYKQKKFKPYTEKELKKLLIEIKKIIPCWVRVERIIRDIPPTNIVEGGSNLLNMREVVAKEMAKQGTTCKCIRCREVGADYDAKEKIYLFKQEYEASEGKEIFLSFENKTRSKLYALLRLRLLDFKAPSALKLPFVAIVRELHVYGQMSKIKKMYEGRPNTNNAQHTGLGKKLMAKAEKIAKKYGAKKIAVISGVGVRGYYRKLGYKLQNTYMVKNI